jgi:hypothetical protein
VAIVMGIGHEAVRYLVGYAVALSPGREPIVITLDQIYGLVIERWEEEPSPARY